MPGRPPCCGQSSRADGPVFQGCRGRTGQATCGRRTMRIPTGKCRPTRPAVAASGCAGERRMRAGSPVRRLDQLHRRSFVAVADPPDELDERRIVGALGDGSAILAVWPHDGFPAAFPTRTTHFDRLVARSDFTRPGATRHSFFSPDCSLRSRGEINPVSEDGKRLKASRSCFLGSLLTAAAREAELFDAFGARGRGGFCGCRRLRWELDARMARSSEPNGCEVGWHGQPATVREPILISRTWACACV